MLSGKRIAWFSTGALMMIAVTVVAGAAAMSAISAETVKASWEHHTASFNYYGITALYSCDALESNVRALLVHLGARRDAKVIARGCPGGSDTPSRNATLDADFYSLAPADDPHDTVPAVWMRVEVSAIHPNFMGRGDCELIDAMKDLILKNFSLRTVSYQAVCTPHEVNIDDFSIKAKALKPLDSSGKNRF